jgi:hypothetical protein
MMAGGEYRCRVCGLAQADPIWGSDGQCPTFEICACCGCEFGYQDCTPEGIQRHRSRWFDGGGAWLTPSEMPSDWSRPAQQSVVPQFYLRVLAGLPGTGPEPLQFSDGGRTHAEGFVVELTLASGDKWVGNFQPGIANASLALSDPNDPKHALIVSGGQAYVLEPETRKLVRSFGGGITDVLLVPNAAALIVGNGLWFERVEGGETVWQTRRISWDGMMDVRVDGEVLRGHAYDPIADEWTPFRVDIQTGEVTGGAYPPELP